MKQSGVDSKPGNRRKSIILIDMSELSADLQGPITQLMYVFGGYCRLGAQESVLTNKQTASQIGGQRLVASVELIKALGGGWAAGNAP